MRALLKPRSPSQSCTTFPREEVRDRASAVNLGHRQRRAVRRPEVGALRLAEYPVLDCSPDQQRRIAVGSNDADLVTAGDDSGRPRNAARRRDSLLPILDPNDGKVAVRASKYLTGADVERVAVVDESVSGVKFPDLLEVSRPGRDTTGAQRCRARTAPSKVSEDALVEVTSPDCPVPRDLKMTDAVAQTASAEDPAVLIDRQGVQFRTGLRPAATSADDQERSVREHVGVRMRHRERPDLHDRRRDDV